MKKINIILTLMITLTLFNAVHAESGKDWSFSETDWAYTPWDKLKDYAFDYYGEDFNKDDKTEVNKRIAAWLDTVIDRETDRLEELGYEASDEDLKEFKDNMREVVVVTEIINMEEPYERATDPAVDYHPEEVSNKSRLHIKKKFEDTKRNFRTSSEVIQR